MMPQIDENSDGGFAPVPQAPLICWRNGFRARSTVRRKEKKEGKGANEHENIGLCHSISLFLSFLPAFLCRLPSIRPHEMQDKVVKRIFLFLRRAAGPDHTPFRYSLASRRLYLL